MSNSDFTRNRKQSFSGALLFMMNRITKTLSIEIDNFIQVLNQNKVSSACGLFTKSAFVQYRKKIKAEVFKQLSDNLVNEFYTDNEENILLWRGFRLLSVDGSKLTLPNTKELQNEFGIARNQTDSNQNNANQKDSNQHERPTNQNDSIQNDSNQNDSKLIG